MSRIRSKSEKGASAVEFALIAPILILLTVGIIELGLLMWNLSRTQSSVAAAVRTAGTQSRIDGYEDEVSSLIQAALQSGSAVPVSLVVFRADPTTGRPATLAVGQANYAACTADCFVYTWVAATKSWTKAASPTWNADQQRACGPTSETDFIGVWLKSKYLPITGAGIRPVFVTRGIARLEPVPLSTGQACKP
jgi:Flp pilus assembly protein TadG